MNAFEPLAWDCKAPAPEPGRNYTLTFQGHGEWKWFGKAPDATVAEQRARLVLTRLHPEFSGQARLVAIEVTP